jgi:hypothetical protein
MDSAFFDFPCVLIHSFAVACILLANVSKSLSTAFATGMGKNGLDKNTRA